jgi:hypothetical protein
MGHQQQFLSRLEVSRQLGRSLLFETELIEGFSPDD